MRMKLVRALVPVLVWMLTACGHAISGESASSGVLRMTIGTDPPGLNALVANNAQVSFLSPLIHGFLLRADGEGRLIPDLATEVPAPANGGVSRDGRIVTYHLRRGAHWHDGAPFDARDVVFSFAAAM